MSRAIQQSEFFWNDMVKQVDWYRDNASPEIAEQFVLAVETTLRTLAETPGLGRPRFKDWLELQGIHSWGVQGPYHRFLVFYRFTDKNLIAERLIHGARDLGRRLLESPSDSGD